MKLLYSRNLLLLSFCWLLVGCISKSQPTGSATVPAANSVGAIQQTRVAEEVTVVVTDLFQEPATPTAVATGMPTATPIVRDEPARLIPPMIAGVGGHPTLLDFWEGRATFELEVEETGLPMGESETILMSNGELWSYVHASDRSAGTIDRCGDPVEFPGCTVIYKSVDGGYAFTHENPPVCQFECNQCPCDSEIDHIDQQQYPDVAFYEGQLLLVHEYRGRTIFRHSTDGLNWSEPEHVGETGHWYQWWKECSGPEKIGEHPFVPYDYECLAGAPPGIYVEGEDVYVFVGLGQNPGSMGCFKGTVYQEAVDFQRCTNNPLFSGAPEYGWIEGRGEPVNDHFDFKTVSSADILAVGDQYYIVYEGVRGPGPGDPGDTQFGLGLARTVNGELDGSWEKYAENPILVDLPANIGIGHADLIVLQGETILYTSLDGVKRSRLRLVWLAESE